MSNNAPEQDQEHSVQEFAEQVIESLEPGKERYETRLGDDFYVCTFPNGLKTWMYVYEVNGFRRRRTLGTYPEMTLNDARESLFAARKLQQAEESLIERGLTDVVVRGGAPEQVPGSVAGPSAQAGQQSSRPTTPLHWRIVRTLGTALVGAVAGMAALLVISPLPTMRPAPDDSGATTAAGAPAPRTDDATGTLAGGQGLGGEDGAPGDGTATAQPPSPEQLAIEAMLPPIVRELFVSSVTNEEPGPELPNRIVLSPDESRRVHYFTEVRNMGGKRLRHRWRQGLQEVAQFSLDVPERSERWEAPLSSSIELQGLASEGAWRVELLSESGEVIDYHLFEVIAEASTP